MRKSFLAFLILVAASPLCAQNTVDTTPLFKQFPFVPAFKLLKTDSVTFFSKDDLKKNKAVLMMIFSPTCEHCQHETEEILKKIKSFKNVQIVMSTNFPFKDIRDFEERFKLNKYKNITVGFDVNYMLPTFFMIHNLPYLAMYDSEWNLIKTFEGNMKIEDLVAVFK